MVSVGAGTSATAGFSFAVSSRNAVLSASKRTYLSVPFLGRLPSVPRNVLYSASMSARCFCISAGSVATWATAKSTNWGGISLAAFDTLATFGAAAGLGSVAIASAGGTNAVSSCFPSRDKTSCAFECETNRMFGKRCCRAGIVAATSSETRTVCTPSSSDLPRAPSRINGPSLYAPLAEPRPLPAPAALDLGVSGAESNLREVLMPFSRMFNKAPRGFPLAIPCPSYWEPISLETPPLFAHDPKWSRPTLRVDPSALVANCVWLYAATTSAFFGSAVAVLPAVVTSKEGAVSVTAGGCDSSPTSEIPASDSVGTTPSPVGAAGPAGGIPVPGGLTTAVRFLLVVGLGPVTSRAPSSLARTSFSCSSCTCCKAVAYAIWGSMPAARSSTALLCTAVAGLFVGNPAILASSAAMSSSAIWMASSWVMPLCSSSCCARRATASCRACCFAFRVGGGAMSVGGTNSVGAGGFLSSFFGPLPNATSAALVIAPPPMPPLRPASINRSKFFLVKKSRLLSTNFSAAALDIS